jgi:hypothetical protein
LTEFEHPSRAGGPQPETGRGCRSGTVGRAARAERSGQSSSLSQPPVTGPGAASSHQPWARAASTHWSTAVARRHRRAASSHRARASLPPHRVQSPVRPTVRPLRSVQLPVMGRTAASAPSQCSRSCQGINERPPPRASSHCLGHRQCDPSGTVVRHGCVQSQTREHRRGPAWQRECGLTGAAVQSLACCQ